MDDLVVIIFLVIAILERATPVIIPEFILEFIMHGRNSVHG
jgi:hypothetical protein